MILIKQKQVALLLALREQKTFSVSLLAKETNVSYPFAENALSEFEKAGLVSFEKKGRIKIVKLTEKGSALASVFLDIAQKLSVGQAGEQKK